MSGSGVVVLWAILGIGAPLAALVFIVVLRVRFGWETRPAFPGQYLRDIPRPSLPPALVGFIWRRGSVGREDATVTLLDLVDRGVIAVERVEHGPADLPGERQAVSYRLSVQDDELDGLLEWEHSLVHFLFIEIAGDWSLVLADLKDLAAAKRAEFARGYRAWTATVAEEGSRRGYLDARADRAAFAGATLGFAAVVASGAAGLVSGAYWFLLGVPVGVALILVARGIQRRSPEAAGLHAQYEALRRYLDDFGRMDEQPPDAVAVWRQFLVYAVVFGMADEVVSTLRARAPEVMRDPAFQTMALMMVAPPGGGPSVFAAMDESLGQAVATSTSMSGAN